MAKQKRRRSAKRRSTRKLSRRKSARRLPPKKNKRRPNKKELAAGIVALGALGTGVVLGAKLAKKKFQRPEKFRVLDAILSETLIDMGIALSKSLIESAKNIKNDINFQNAIESSGKFNKEGKPKTKTAISTAKDIVVGKNTVNAFVVISYVDNINDILKGSISMFRLDKSEKNLENMKIAIADARELTPILEELRPKGLFETLGSIASTASKFLAS